MTVEMACRLVFEFIATMMTVLISVNRPCLDVSPSCSLPNGARLETSLWIMNVITWGGCLPSVLGITSRDPIHVHGICLPIVSGPAKCRSISNHQVLSISS